MARKTADLPLHSGAAPSWLFRRMVELAGAIGTLVVRDQGPEELLRGSAIHFGFKRSVACSALIGIRAA